MVGGPRWVGAQLTSDERVRGVMFTGSTEVATLLQRNIATRLDAQGRPIPLIAETGGMNAMIVDSLRVDGTGGGRRPPASGPLMRWQRCSVSRPASAG